jgi:hypothetical protein
MKRSTLMLLALGLLLAMSAGGQQRSRTGTNAANSRDVILPDGRRLFITSPGTGAPAD